jgi:ribosome-binding protein aMBF1 (putative translation factor)
MCYSCFRGSDEITSAEALEDARLKLGLSQTELAREIRVSFTITNRYENGHHMLEDGSNEKNRTVGRSS